MDSQHPYCLISLPRATDPRDIFPSILIYLLMLFLFNSFKAAIFLEYHVCFPVKTRRYNFIADFLVLWRLKDFLPFHDFSWALVEGVILEVHFLSLLQWSCKNSVFKKTGQLTRLSVPSMISFLKFRDLMSTIKIWVLLFQL